MKTLTAKVTSARLKGGGQRSDGKRVEVGSVTYFEYDTLAEAVSALGEEKILGLANAQVATDAKNRKRAEAVGGVSEKALREEATQRLMSGERIGDTVNQLNSAGTDPLARAAKLTALTDAEIEVIKKEKGIGASPEVDEEEAAADSSTPAA